jgi:hypothetical protein
LFNLNFNHSFKKIYIFPTQPQLKVLFIEQLFSNHKRLCRHYFLGNGRCAKMNNFLYNLGVFLSSMCNAHSPTIPSMIMSNTTTDGTHQYFTNQITLSMFKVNWRDDLIVFLQLLILYISFSHTFIDLSSKVLLIPWRACFSGKPIPLSSLTTRPTYVSSLDPTL